MGILKEKKLRKYRRTIFSFCFFCLLISVNAQNNGENGTNSSQLKVQENLKEKQDVVMDSQDPETMIQSVSTVSGNRLLHRPTFMMESFLDGTLPGLYIDMNQGYATNQRSLSLRGRTPLILVDGIPRSDANIPASQIESVSIIKDGLGLSMMVMSSGNGVIYIKTKRGQKSSLKIDFTAQLAFSRQMHRPEYLGAYEYSKLLNEALGNEGKSPMYTDRDLELYRTGASPYTHPDVNWYDQVMRDYAPIQQYNLNMSGGGNVARYFIDLNVYDQDGFLKQDNSINTYRTRENFKKYSLRTNTDIQVTDNTLFKVNVFGQMFRETTPGKTMMGSIYRSLHTTPNNAYPVFNPDGSLGGSTIYRDNNIYGQVINSGYYLYPKTDFNLDLTLQHDFSDLLQGLYATATYSYNSSYREELNRSKNFAVYNYWLDPDNTDPTAEGQYIQMASSGNQANSTGYSRLNRLQYLEAAVGYDFDINKHSIRTKLLYSFNDYIIKALNIPLSKNAVSFKAEYNFDKKYLAELSFATMSMNQLKPGERWGWFPALGAGWNMSKEEWFDVSAINNLKLRASYGINGSDGTGSYYRSGDGTLSNYYYTYIKYYNTTNNGAYFGSSPSGEQMLVEANLPFISKWTKIHRLNIGADITAFDNTLTATVEYFHNKYSDILQQPVGKASNHIIGMTIPSENIGKYNQNGLELNVSYNNRFGDVAFSANANAVFYKTKLLENGENEYPEAYMQRVGKKYGQIFGYVADGFFQNQQEIDSYLATTKISDYTPQPGDLKYRDLNNDGILDGKDIKEIGTNAPRIEYGVYLGAEWKGLALSMQWSGLGNADVIHREMPFGINFKGGYGQAMQEHLDRWSPENPNARYPRLTAGSNSYNEQNSTFWIKNSAYFRLKNVELSYTLPKQWTSAIHLSGVKFFANGYNLITLTGIKDRDPELLNYLSGSSGIVPNVKAFNFGLNIQF